MTQHGHLVATLFDLTPTEWALVLPEGELNSNADAASYLAFYDATGTPASRAQVERRRDPKAVQAALDRLRQALAGCTD